MAQEEAGLPPADPYHFQAYWLQQHWKKCFLSTYGGGQQQDTGQGRMHFLPCHSRHTLQPPSDSIWEERKSLKPCPEPPPLWHLLPVWCSKWLFCKVALSRNWWLWQEYLGGKAVLMTPYTENAPTVHKTFQCSISLGEDSYSFEGLSLIWKSQLKNYLPVKGACRLKDSHHKGDACEWKDCTAIIMVRDLIFYFIILPFEPQIYLISGTNKTFCFII